MDKMSQMLGCFKTMNYVYLVVLSGNLLALTGDAAIAWPSPVLVKIDSDDGPLDRRPTEDELTWVASMSGFGSFASVLPFSLLPDIIGRKWSLLLIAIPHIVSFALAAFANTIEMIYISRFLSGLSISACYIVLPMYVAEISENSNRGLMLVSFAIFSNFGSLLSYLTGPYLTMFWFNIFLLSFPLCFFISFLLVAPESPYFYIMKKEMENARNSLIKLRKNNCDYSKIEEELDNILKESETSRRNVSDILGTLTRKHAIKGTLIAIMLTSFQQLSGYAVFVPYTQKIFKEIGSDIDSALSSIVVGSVAFLASFLCPFIIDKRGRRFVLITSTIGIIFFEVLFGLYYFLRDGNNSNIDSVKWLPLFCLIGYMLFYTFGLGPLPLTVTSEILPVNIKFLVSTFAGLLGTVSSTIMQKNYYVLNDNLGYYGTIWLFAFLCSILLIFIVIFLPETKGKRFSEILEELER